MKSGPPSERLVRNISITLLLALIGFILSDLVILSMRDKWFPNSPPPAKTGFVRPVAQADRGFYDAITRRNIFRADQTDPPPAGVKDDKGQQAPDADPVLSSLPIQLIGTIVHANPLRSIATVLLKNKNDQVPVRVEGEIPDGLAVVTKIERAKVIFRNNATRALEYIEMKDDSKLSFQSGLAKPTGPKQVGEVLQKSDNEFELNQSDVTRLTNNLPQVLQDARAIPKLNPDGSVEGFTLVDIKPGSIYEKLGLKPNDTIKGVNGEKVDSPGKAMDMYNALRSGASNIQISINRNGRDENFNYSIKQ